MSGKKPTPSLEAASDPSTPPSKLAAFASGYTGEEAPPSKARPLVAALIKNPSTPAETALALCHDQELTDHLFDNPSLPLWLLTLPHLFDEAPMPLLQRLAGSPRASSALIEQLYRQTDLEHYTPEQQDDPLAVFFLGILRNPSSPDHLLAEIYFRLSGLRGGVIPPEEIPDRLGDNRERLSDPPAGGGQLSVWQAIAGVSLRDPTEAELRATLALGPWSALAVASSTAAPGVLLDELHGRGDPEIDDALAANAATRPETLGKLGARHLRVLGARFLSNPRDLAGIVFTTDGSKVLSGLAGNRSTPPDLLREMATTLCFLHLQAADRLLETPRLPPEALSCFLGSPSARHREKARRSPALVAPWLAGADAAGALPYQRMPAGSFDLEQISGWLAGGPWYHALAAAHPGLPASMLDRLDPRWLVGTLMALNQRLVSGDQLFWLLRALGHFGEISAATRSSMLVPWVYLRLGEDPIGERAIEALASQDDPSQWLRGPLTSVLGAAPTDPVRRALSEALRR